jgi:hypothetical protein
MDRYALLIDGSNINGEKHLPGAEKDVAAMREYLMSPVGGSWHDDEIEIINQKPLKLIKLKLICHDKDFCLVYFSGHGSEEEKGVPTVCLNDNEKDVPVQALHPIGEYGIVITDCCRGNGQETLNENVGNENFAIRTACDVNEASRDLWDRALKKYIDENKSQGIVEMLSCSYNEDANETYLPDAHGYYSYELIQAAKDWYENVESNSCLTTLEIHRAIYDYMVRQGQHPCYTPKKLEYPFAVKA